MNKGILWMVLLAAGLGALGGYWLAVERLGGVAGTVLPVEKKPLFYRHPMNPAVTSPVPSKDEMGMDYIPVYDEATPSTTRPPFSKEDGEQQGTSASARKILYYRNPMGLPDTSPVPKKDAMGMDYTPVYQEEPDNNAMVLNVGSEKIQRLGVKTVPVEKLEIAHTIRGVGTVEADERRLSVVTVRFDGFIERLYVNTTGQSVTRGQPLFELYSPDLVAAQQEYLTAQSGQAALSNGETWLQSGMGDLAANSLERLRNWGISEQELLRLQQQGKVQHAMVVRSPTTGIVMEKLAVAGARAMAGETLFKIADLSQVWVIAEVYEQDISLIKPGDTALASFDAYPGRTFKGKVGFVYPMLNPTTRTVKVRIELANPEGLLKPMMYAQIGMAGQTRTALAVPQSAVLESGRQTLVLVDLGAGRFEPRPVTVGLRGAAPVFTSPPSQAAKQASADVVEILAGLHEQERVVVSANFLIDAESNLKSALSGFAPATSPPMPDAAPPSPDAEKTHGGM